ncbi:hypothetical protein UF64_01715 [Thalassospira sp. HJ]|nr:hypothetical protein UF64_01715 [Thalassospira sp. HJ]
MEINDFGDVADLGLRPVVVASYWHKQEFEKLGIGVDVVANPESAWRFLNADRADILFEDEEPGWFDLTETLGVDIAKAYATTGIVPTSNLFILFSRQHPDGQKLRKAFDAFMASKEGQDMRDLWSIHPDERQILQDAIVKARDVD